MIGENASPEIRRLSRKAPKILDADSEYIESTIPSALPLSKRKGRDKTVVKPLTD